MSVLFEAHQVGLPTKSHKVSRTRRKEDDLLVFGYACKLFENSEKAAAFDAEKNLISWMGDETLRIDRYDARLYFTDKAQFTTKSSDLASSLTPEEQEIERQCDEERYMDLHRDMAQYEIQQEEEMKRFQQALQEDGTYNSVAFSYQYDAPPIPPQYPQTANEYESFQNDLQQPQQASTSDGKTSVSPPPTPPSFQEPEPFVPPKELEIPLGMEIPDTAKMQAIIERTAVFVTKQGKQMEILVKAKQSGNPQFDFLLMENWLNPYYKHVLKYITEGKYVPEIPKPPSVQTQEETKESDTDESEDDSDGEYELHPLLQASLHKKITRSKPSSASSSPIPHVLGNKFNRTFAPVTSGLNSTAFPCNQNHGDNSYHSEVDEVFDYSMWYPQDDGHGHFVSSAGYPYHPPMAPVLSVADLIPPPPPPPGEGPLEEEWLDSTTSVPPLPPPPPPPVPPGLFLPNTAEIPGAFPPPPPPGLSEVPLAPQSIIPPPPDLQPIVDKLATYVAKNGPDFESIIKAKDDPRFEFLNPWNTHHSYYNLKKQEALASLQLRKSEETQKNEKNSYEVPKGPISFSIKVKDTKKPKIEYRTSVIYKQSCEQGESDDDGDEEGSEAQYQDRNDTGGKQSGEMTKSQQEQEASNQTPAEDLNEQMDSIKAAERIAQNLESESRDKQLQIERRRKASLFISMLKKTNTGDETETNQSSSDSETGRSRKFMETKRDTRAESPSVKRSRIEDDDDDDDDDLLSIGVGAPSPGSIRVTQDLMAKVLAASKNK